MQAGIKVLAQHETIYPVQGHRTERLVVCELGAEKNSRPVNVIALGFLFQCGEMPRSKVTFHQPVNSMLYLLV
jgi:hypothetical protein